MARGLVTTPYGGHDSILTGKGRQEELTKVDLGEEGLLNRRWGPGGGSRHRKLSHLSLFDSQVLLGNALA